MGQLLDAERQAEMRQAMLNFQQTMMMNQAPMNSPCSCLSDLVCVSTMSGDTTRPEPSTFSAAPLSTVQHPTVGHSTFGPGPIQCDPMTTMRRQAVGTQSGPYGCQLQSSSPTSAGAQLGSAVQPHAYGGLAVQGTYFRNLKLPAILTSFYIAGETILEVPHPRFPQPFVRPITASFSCTTLDENMATPTETDWSQESLRFLR